MTAAAVRQATARAVPRQAGQPAPDVDLNVVDAMNHPRLFQAWFYGRTWNNWRTVLRAAFALPMSDAERAFFRTVAERDPPAKPVRELWCIVGRGGGKDSIASLITAHAAALFNRRDRLRPGERALCMCLACDRDQAKIVLDYTRSYFTDIPPLKAMVRRETAQGFELDNSVDIAIATNSFRSTRGRTLLCAVLDECAFWRSEATATPDEEVYRAIGPGLARMPGSILVAISSPHGKRGLLYDKFRDHYGRDKDDVLVIRAPSTVFNPTLDERIISEALTADPFGARAEWLGQFRDDISGWAPRELIEAAVDCSVTVRAPHVMGGPRYVGFADPSGGQGDSFTLGIAHMERGLTAVLDCVVEIASPFSTDAAVEQIAATLKSYRLAKVTGDRFAERWVADAFARQGIRYEHSEEDRSGIYANMLPLLTSGRVRLLDNKRLIHQFAGLERTVLPAGRVKIDHVRGAMDDLSNAAAGACVLAAASASFSLNITRAAIARGMRPSPQQLYGQFGWP
jgi:hypothetical protein